MVFNKRTTIFLLGVAAVCTAAAPLVARTQGHEGKSTSSRRPVDRGPGTLTDAQLAEDLDQTLRDFYEIIGKSGEDSSLKTGEQASTPRSMP